MNRYPLWGNLAILGIVVLSTILALPNFFGDDEAIQVSRTDGVAMDVPALEQVRTTLMDGGIEYLSAEIEGASALVRVENLQVQESARDALTKAFPNHVVALSLAPRTPGWLRAIGLEPMLLGPDLRGGVHFLSQVDLDAAVGQYLETYETALRTQLRERQIRNDVSVVGTSLRVAIIEPADMDRAEEIIRQLDTSDQLLQLGQLTSRLIVDRAQIDGRPGFNVRITEAAIRELIRAAYPDHGILGEENGRENRGADLTWVIDPIDGTKAFITGVPVWGTLIALNAGGRAVLGVLDQPFLGERYAAGPDGTYLGERRLATRACPDLAEARLCCPEPGLFNGAGLPASPFRTDHWPGVTDDRR